MNVETSKRTIDSPAKPVAITGYSHRLPGGLRSDADFWNLLEQRESIRVPIAGRYGRGFQPIGKDPGVSRLSSPYEGLICDDGELEFDRSLFGVSQFELTNMNPQVRMLLSCAWEVIEHTGWDIRKLKNSSTGVFVGAQTPAVANWRPVYGSNEFSIINTSLAMLANQVSYHFNLMGSSMTYCTACSAGLSAIYTAFNALAWGHCEQAIVGSVNYLGSARQSAGFTNLGVVSPDGKCNSFDANANGYMRSEGCIVFALKLLEEAENDGDHIFAVIESTAVNSAGAADDSEGLSQGRYITAPTRHSQISLMRNAMALAEREPEQFDYLEAHATGTVVGDRIEGNAISEAFSSEARSGPLRLSSVKSNIGHLEAAAFNASLLKVVLMMNRRTFAPISRNFFEPNPEIDFGKCPMKVLTRCEPFPDHAVTVGINSFGIGGANGHCVISEYRPNRKRLWSTPMAPNGGYMVPLSARTPESLSKSVENLTEFLKTQQVDLYTLAGNLSRRRTHFDTRISFSALDQEHLLELLSQFDNQADPGDIVRQHQAAPNIAMVFAGQGTQWSGCGRRLYDTQPVFRRIVDAIEDEWLQHADNSLREACFFAEQGELDQASLAQPVIFMIQCALFELIRSWGVRPAVVVGHSSGEVAAAYASGALSLSAATRLIFHRSQIQQLTAGSGRMLAVGIDQPGLVQLLEELRVSLPHTNGEQVLHIETACLNSPASLVVCGPESDIYTFADALDSRKIQNRLLRGNIAFHSTAMEQIREAVFRKLSFLNERAFHTGIPFISSVTAAQANDLDANYWWSNIRETVNFKGAIDCIRRNHSIGLFLEISPHGALQAMIAQCLYDLNPQPRCISTLSRDTDERITFNDALGELFRSGVSLDFEAHYPSPRSISHVLPGHPKTYQTPMEATVDDEMFVYEGGFSHGPLIGHRIYCDHLRFEASLSRQIIPYLADHKVQSSAIMPAAGYMELVFEALQGKPAYFEEIEFLQPCPIPEIPIRLQTALYPMDESEREYAFSISSRTYISDAKSELHCRGRVSIIDTDCKVSVARTLSEVDTTGFTMVFDEAEGGFYERIEATLGNRFQYGPYFQTVRNLKTNPATKDFMFDVEMDRHLWETGQEEGYVLCPPLVDGALQIFLCNLMQATDLFAIPRRAKHITYLKPPSSPRISVHVTKPDDGWFIMDDIGQLTVTHGEKSGGNMRFYDAETGELFLHVEDYIYFTSNPNWTKAPASKHVVLWQPKFLEPAHTDNPLADNVQLQPAELIQSVAVDKSGNQRVLHIIELAGEREPNQTLLNQCVKQLDQQLQIEYWLISSTAELSQACYDAFHHYGTSLRFAAYDEASLAKFETGSGLLRNSAAQILFLHMSEIPLTSDDWGLFGRLSVAGGYAYVARTGDAVIQPDCGWTTVREQADAALFQAPQSLARSQVENQSAAFRLVICDCSSTIASWCQLIGKSSIARICKSIQDAIGFLDEQRSETKPITAIDCYVENEAPLSTGEQISIEYMRFIQALIDYKTDQPENNCRINIITQRAVMDVRNPAASSIWGMIRSASLEIGGDSGLDFRLCDIGEPADDLNTLAWLATNDVREREIAIRNGRLWAPRLVHLRDRHPVVIKPGESVYRLTLENPGQVTGLQFKTYELPDLGDRDIEVEIKFAALNFRDVMVALGMLPPLAYERSMLGREVGMEASAVVRRVGSDVTNHHIGDEVLFTQGGCIANRAVVSEFNLFTKPDCLNMTEASSVLSVYVTAYYALFHLAGLSSGQRVLIHSAMGGVGQAAIQLAKHAGAEVYATAGNKSKRHQLIEMGVKAAFDSRSYEWHDELMRETDGIDVVLNSLAGHHVKLCLQALRPGGWHLEIGKVDIYADNALNLNAFRKNLRFAAIDIDRLMCDNPELTRKISEACLELLSDNKVNPIPSTVYQYGDYADALRLMTSGQHQGKLVLQAPSGDDINAQFSIADRRAFLDPDATYLITGGFGDLGLKLLPYFFVNGARHFTFMDRNPERNRTPDWIREWSALTYFGLDVEIDIVPGDVSNLEDVRNCIDGLSRELKGVFHLAGILDDKLISEMTPNSISKVFAPKAEGALNLHKATEGLQLDYFVLFSSIASVYGNLAQSNYSAASAFLDGLATYRRQRGLPALSCNLSGITESGMASRDLHVMRMIRSTGMPPVSLSFAARNLDYALRDNFKYDHVLTAAFERPPWTVESSEYMRSGRSISNQNSFQKDSESQLTLEGLMTQIFHKVAELCGHDEGNVDDPLSSFGLTSISVAELGAFVQSEFGYQVSTLDLMTTSTCRSIASAILSGNQIKNQNPAQDDPSQSRSAVNHAHEH